MFRAGVLSLLLLLLLAGTGPSPSGPSAHAADLTPQRSVAASPTPHTSPGIAALTTATATPRATPPPIYSFTPVATSTRLTATATPTSTVSPAPTASAVPPSVTTTPTPSADLAPPQDQTPDSTVAPAPREPCPIALEVTTSQEQYRLSEQARMPTDVTAQVDVTGLCDPTDTTIDDLIFIWTVSISYVPADFDPGNGPSQPIRYLWPPQRSEGAEPFSPDFGDVVRGGTLTLTAVTTIDGLLYSARKSVTILGTNPSRAVAQSYFSSEFPNSHYTLWRIAQAESDLRQFNDDGYPKWSSDGHYGVGIMQITYPEPTDDEVWNWKLNADAGSRVLQGAYAVARNWPTTVARSREFSLAVEAYNAAREKAELPKLTRVSVPEFTSGNLLCNLQQRELDAIRLYNGAGGTDQLGLPLHEFRLAYDATEGMLELVVDEENLTASAQWVQVAADERPRGHGVPDYVGKVLARPPPAAC